MKSIMRIFVVIVLLSSSLLMHPANAQLHGNWPSDPHWQMNDHAQSPSEKRINNRQSDNAPGIPRGDLRKDVSDASRDQRTRPAR